MCKWAIEAPDTEWGEALMLGEGECLILEEGWVRLG